MIAGSLSFRSSGKHSELFLWGLFIAWGVTVSLIATHHEFWRDEVRALSLVVQSSSLSDLFTSMQNEGHPLLWYLLLYTGYGTTGSVVVLPLLSFIIAGASVYLLIFFSPFPRWMKTLFIFSGLPLYEYSVMARNYGISMLLLFAFAALYPSRNRYPLVLGLLLASLSNTNIHSLILACLLMGLWTWDTLIAENHHLLSAEARKLYMAMAIVIAGSAGALYTVWPTETMIASDTTRHTLSHIVNAAVTAIVAPATQFGELFPNFVPVKARIGLLLLPIMGLIVRPPVTLIAYAALLALSLLFSVVYSSWYRHQGLLVVFLMSLYWIVLASEKGTLCHKRVRGLFKGGLYGGMALLLLATLVTGGTNAYRDWIYQKSASKAFAQEFLNAGQKYKDAILIGEPDFLLEAVPYYAANPIYIKRESRFGDAVRFVRNVQLDLGMGELLCTAWRIQKERNTPVLIVLGHRVLGMAPSDSNALSHSVSYFYQRTFAWSGEELENWRRYTVLERQFDRNVIGDEAYTVYSLNSTEASSPPHCSPGHGLGKDSTNSDHGLDRRISQRS
ncbi:MAG: hypothetical protein QM771_00315 [Nitrospira sp.]